MKIVYCERTWNCPGHAKHGLAMVYVADVATGVTSWGDTLEDAVRVLQERVSTFIRRKAEQDERGNGMLVPQMHIPNAAKVVASIKANTNWKEIEIP